MRAPALARVLVLIGSCLACGPDPQWDSEIEGERRSQAMIRDVQARQSRAASELGVETGSGGDQILFGDLHVHSSYSWDGFLLALPLAGGEGAHPPNDACDFARHCAQLDFFALTDHSESMLPEHWMASKQSIRQCNSTAGDESDPDLVAFMGFEWSQAGTDPDSHWGHRCVVFRDDEEERLPLRPISSGVRQERWEGLAKLVSRGRWIQPAVWGHNSAFVDFVEGVSARPACPAGVDTRELPADCDELAPTPRELHEKLDQWGFPALTIPHGMTWGTYTPAGTTFDKHVDPLQYDGDRMRLVEIMSGHGNSEEFRAWREREIGTEGELLCPEPTPDYLPCCWQAGEIMRGRCDGLSAEECERRVVLAREYAARALTRPQQIFPDAEPEEWLDCDQCRDCFKPSYGYRPRESVQYAMTLSRGDQASERPTRLETGFIASSDNHSARPGTGYKQLLPTKMSEARGSLPFPMNLILLRPQSMEDPSFPISPEAQDAGVLGSDARVTSYLYPGGLAAVHAEGRSREAIWDALQRRQVYATSGPRILLWFDLLNAQSGRAPAPMGTQHRMSIAPRFEVRAVGSFEPLPGCPAESANALSAERGELLCGGECYHPSDRRRPIQAIEIVRIRRQQLADHPTSELIEDPWLRFECPPDEAGCRIRFEDPEFPELGADALYYARVLEAPSGALNGQPLSTRFDAEGRAIETTLCNDERVDAGGCIAPVQERAWSSPIFIDRR